MSWLILSLAGAALMGAEQTSRWFAHRRHIRVQFVASLAHIQLPPPSAELSALAARAQAALHATV